MFGSWRLRVGIAVVVASSILAGAAASALAEAGPRLMLRPGRGEAGTQVTMVLKACNDPRLWVGPSTPLLMAEPGQSGYALWENVATGQSGYEYVGAWTPVRGDWTASVTAAFPAGDNWVSVGCGGATEVSHLFTVR